nr:uncharacterized protein LOC119621191 isoform X1 [Chlorocebus sabaeus]
MGAANGRGRRLRCDGSPAWRRSGRGRCAGGGPSRGGGASRPLLGLRFGEEDAEEAPRRAALWERRPRRPAGPMRNRPGLPPGTGSLASSPAREAEGASSCSKHLTRLGPRFQILDGSGRVNSPFTAWPRGIWVLFLPVAVLSVVGSPWEAECAGSPRGK